MDQLWQDVRQTLRWMGRQKGFTAAASLTLALGIGANTAVFSVLWGVLLEPLPYAEPERLVSVSEEHPGANAPVVWAALSDVTLDSWAQSMRTLEGVAAYGDEVFTVGRESPVRLPGASVSPSLFPLLRVKPAAGRFFLPEEGVEGADGVVVLSQGFWRTRFGASPSAIGRSIFLDGRPRRIVGVAPPGFDFPSPEAALWTPHVFPRAADPEQRGMQVFPALGRLRPGATPAQAAAEGTAAARAVPRPMAADLLLGKGRPVEVRVRPLAEERTAAIRPALVLLAVAVGLVLLIACANVSNLYLSRGIARQRELAVRAALGAGRRRLVRQLLTETLVLSAFGGALGLLLAWGLVRAVPALAPDDLPRLAEIQLDGRALAFAAAATLLAGLLSGLVPAWRSTRRGLAPVLHEGDGRATGATGKRLRGGLLVAEAALAVLLLVGAGLLLRSFAQILRVDGGYEPSNVLTAQLFLPMTAGGAGEEVRGTAAVHALLERVAALPGVAAAGAANMAPFGGSTTITGFSLPGGPDGAPTVVRANTWVVTPGFGQALGLRVKSGRFLAAGDVASGTQALVVNEELVRLFLSDGRPVVGRRFPAIHSKKGGVAEIVGVVGNVLKDGPRRAPQPEIYFAAGSSEVDLRSHAFLLVRTAGDPLALAPELRRLAGEAVPRAALDEVGSLTGRFSAAVAQPRFAALVLAAFAALALALAAVGLYGVLSYGVSQRRREIGVRSALGADKERLLRLVLWEGLALTVAGLALGLGAALAATRWMASLLFGVQPLDGVTFAAAPVVMLGVAAVACLIPANRAAGIDPAEALRSE